MSCTCKTCGSVVNDNVNYCPNCGALVTVNGSYNYMYDENTNTYSNGNTYNNAYNNGNAAYGNNAAGNNNKSGAMKTAAIAGGTALGVTALAGLARNMTHRRRPPYMGPMGGGFGGPMGGGPMGGPGGMR